VNVRIETMDAMSAATRVVTIRHFFIVVAFRGLEDV
jgi:hypothetical protein